MCYYFFCVIWRNFYLLNRLFIIIYLLKNKNFAKLHKKNNIYIVFMCAM